MNKKYDVIILGNGILGYSTAFSLIQGNSALKIALIGPSNKLGSASMAAGAMIVSFSELEKGSLKSEYSKLKFDLSLKATKMWTQWVEEINRAIGENLLSVNYGINVIQNTKADESDGENFTAMIETLKQYGEDYYEVDPNTIEGLSPPADGRSLRAVYIPSEGSIKSSDLALAFERFFEISKNNIDLIDDLGVKLKVCDDGLKEISTKSGYTFSSKSLVIACGSKSQEFIDQIPGLNKKIPRLVYGVGTGIVVKTESHAPKKVIRTLNRGLACGVHVVPYDHEVCYIGASNFISPVPEYYPRMTSLYALLQGAMEQIHRKFYKAHVLKYVVGHRPTTIDTFPLLGETSIKGLWILSGTKRDGIHMSPLLGKSFALEILGGKCLFENKFLPERKPIHTMTKEEGINKAVQHLKSAGFQHELRLPKAGWDEMIEDTLRKKVEAIYDKCGITDFGIPAEMLDMYKYGHVGEIEKAHVLSH